MSTLEEVNTELDSVKEVITNIGEDVDSLLEQVAALKQQIEDGGLVTQDNLDTLFDKAKSIKDSLTAVDAKEPSNDPTEPEAA